MGSVVGLRYTARYGTRIGTVCTVRRFTAVDCAVYSHAYADHADIGRRVGTVFADIQTDSSGYGYQFQTVWMDSLRFTVRSDMYGSVQTVRSPVHGSPVQFSSTVYGWIAGYRYGRASDIMTRARRRFTVQVAVQFGRFGTVRMRFGLRRLRTDAVHTVRLRFG